MILPTLLLEEDLWRKGCTHVAGVDEAGKGPWAGPVTAGAVVIHTPSQVVSSVRDSKLMSNSQRESAFDKICKNSSAFGVGIVEAGEIDSIGIESAVKKAMLLALQEVERVLCNSLSFVIVDGSKTQTLDIYKSMKILKGGLYHYSIAAGSILAKVTRDRVMRHVAKSYPEYFFEKHMGYGTKLHQQTLLQYGPCPLHRMSYAPVKNALKVAKEC